MKSNHFLSPLQVSLLALSISIPSVLFAQSQNEVASLTVTLPDAPQAQAYGLAGQNSPESSSQTSVTEKNAADHQKKTLEHDQAERQLKDEEHQHILGVVPNFNTVTGGTAPPLNSHQKIELALRSSVNPFQFVAAALTGALSQAQDDFHEYGQGMQGYGKRVGASYTDSFNATIIGNAFFPILLHQDP